jgi:hypothetical protein
MDPKKMIIGLVVLVIIMGLVIGGVIPGEKYLTPTPTPTKMSCPSVTCPPTPMKCPGGTRLGIKYKDSDDPFASDFVRMMNFSIDSLQSNICPLLYHISGVASDGILTSRNISSCGDSRKMMHDDIDKRFPDNLKQPLHEYIERFFKYPGICDNNGNVNKDKLAKETRTIYNMFCPYTPSPNDTFFRNRFK